MESSSTPDRRTCAICGRPHAPTGETGVFGAPPVLHLCDNCRTSVEMEENLLMVVCTTCGRARAFSKIPDLAERLGHAPTLEDHFQFAERCYRCTDTLSEPMSFVSVTQWRQRNHA